MKACVEKRFHKNSSNLCISKYTSGLNYEKKNQFQIPYNFFGSDL